MEDYAKHYMVLGLQPGATQEEIRSAFRRMVKLYHPDQDTSLDAEMRYYEARQSYDVLREMKDSQSLKSHDSNFAETRQTVRDYNFTVTHAGAGWYAYESDKHVNFGDLLKEYGTGRKISARIPFSLGKIPVILWESIKEVASAGMMLRILLHIVVMTNVFDSDITIFCALVVFAFFRYYFSGVHAANFWGSILYSVGAGFLFHIFNPIDPYDSQYLVSSLVLSMLSMGLSSLLPTWLLGILLVTATVFFALFLLWSPWSIWMRFLTMKGWR
ncbi:MAG: DnaJ domain-containing protein [Synergistaceae bacterium]|nr:DnaJ domain-containing protein [Synergistaceae bacterium]